MLIIFFLSRVGSKSLTVQPRGWALVSAIASWDVGGWCWGLAPANRGMEVAVVVSLSRALLCGGSPACGNPDSSDHTACQTHRARVGREHAAGRVWPRAWKFNLKRPPNREHGPRPGRIPRRPLGALTFPASVLAKHRPTYLRRFPAPPSLVFAHPGGHRSV